MAQHNFIRNILELSSNTVNDTTFHTEWICLGYIDLRQQEPQRCICQHLLYAEMYRFLNTKTKRMINVGSTCYKKLSLSTCRESVSMFRKFISGHRGEYQDIIDLIEYSNENWKLFLKELQNTLNSVATKRDLLNDMLLHVQSIIATFEENATDTNTLHRKVQRLTAILEKIRAIITEQDEINAAEAAEEEAVKAFYAARAAGWAAADAAVAAAEARGAAEAAEEEAAAVDAAQAAEEEAAAVAADAAASRERARAIVTYSNQKETLFKNLLFNKEFSPTREAIARKILENHGGETYEMQNDRFNNELVIIINTQHPHLKNSKLRTWANTFHRYFHPTNT